MDQLARECLARTDDARSRKCLALCALGCSLDPCEYIDLAVSYSMDPPLDVLDAAFLLTPPYANHLAKQLADKDLGVAYLPNGNFAGFVGSFGTGVAVL